MAGALACGGTTPSSEPDLVGAAVADVVELWLGGDDVRVELGEGDGVGETLAEMLGVGVIDGLTV